MVSAETAATSHLQDRQPGDLLTRSQLACRGRRIPHATRPAGRVAVMAGDPGREQFVRWEPVFHVSDSIRKPAPTNFGGSMDGQVSQLCRKDAQRWLAENPVFVDVETTGLDGEVIEIGIVDNLGEILLNQRVRPMETIHPAAQAVHGITERDLVAEPMWPDIVGQVRSLLIDRPVIAYNAPFDRARIAWSCERYGLAPMPIEWRDAMPVISAYLDNDQSTPWWTLEDAAKAFGVLPGGHAASADARTVQRIMKRLAG